MYFFLHNRPIGNGVRPPASTRTFLRFVVVVFFFKIKFRSSFLPFFLSFLFFFANRCDTWRFGFPRRRNEKKKRNDIKKKTKKNRNKRERLSERERERERSECQWILNDAITMVTGRRFVLVFLDFRGR